MKSPSRQEDSPFFSPLATQIDRFLQFKRTAGYIYRDGERILRVLDRFLTDRLSKEDPVIGIEIIREFFARWGSESDSARGNRVGVLRQFCLFLSAEDPRTIVPPTHFLRIRRSSFVPRVLTLEESARFLGSCACLPPGCASPLRGVVHGTVLTLLLMTGLRVGEALHLTLDDVDLNSGVLHIRNAKFGKSRFVPMANDVTERMRDCCRRVVRHFGKRPGEAPFFPGPKGAPCSIGVIRISFQRVVNLAEIGPSGRGTVPRLHDLRHSFATNRLALWYRQGTNPSAKLPSLATYLGHVGIASSQRYLHFTDDMLGETIRRHQVRYGYLIS